MASSAAANEAKKLAEAMRKTLNLPHTAFPMRANAAVREPELHARCVTAVYQAQRDLRKDAEPFYLHDGPPFANGSLHMGHFLNKVLKDIINRYKLMRGYRIEYVPGWDCHGLPIEIKALEKLKTSGGADAQSLTPVEVRKISRELATGAMQEQMKDFERWGVLADWTGTPGSVYLTMDPAYEAKQYDVLKQMVQDGLIFRGFKPVYWSPSSQTALAESELEYADNHVSHAAYISFPFHQATSPQAKQLLDKYSDSLSCVIWTTTPWTIPANQALCVNARVEYAIVLQQSTGRHYIVAADLVDSFAKQLAGSEDAAEIQVVDTTTGDVLQGSLFSHPLFGDRKSVVLVGDHVTVDAGTGIVHTAPGHGQDDYFAWISHHAGDSSSAEILCPVDDRGQFTSDAGERLEGLEVLSDGNKAVIELLRESGTLLNVSKYKHRYPYDWRTKKPVILRATAQWFAKLDGLHELGKHVVDEQVEMFPKNSRRRLEATLSSRHEWCISRQRAWGLPIPVFYHKETGEPLINSETISHLQQVVRTYATDDGRKGSDCWWDLSVQELLPASFQEAAGEYVKGTDTLDVWFDSGSSWHAVLPDKNPAELKQANVYLEGSDQHRGWFQSSLLTSLAMQQASPYKHLITHGFALDERGSKMSKSLGNTIVPRDFIEGGELLMPNANPSKKPKAIKVPAYGADVLRFWVASTDYTGDVNIGPSVISKVSDSLRKVRNTARFLLANLNDFDPEKNAVDYNDLTSVDKYMLHLLLQVNKQVTEGYETYAFSRVQSSLAHFISTDLSAFYMEASKDRLYCDAADSASRRSAQTVLWLTLESLSRAIAPVVCHTAEDIRLHWRSQVGHCELDDVAGSIFTDDDAWLPASAQWHDDALAFKWSAIRQLRLEVNRVVEKMRAAEAVGSQLECNVFIIAPDERLVEALRPLTAKHDGTLENVLLCSGVEVSTSEAAVNAGSTQQYRGTCQLAVGDEEHQKIDVTVVVVKARGHKCPRCWKYAPEVDAEETKLCIRCASATAMQSVQDLANALVRESGN